MTFNDLYVFLFQLPCIEIVLNPTSSLLPISSVFIISFHQLSIRLINSCVISTWFLLTHFDNVAWRGRLLGQVTASQRRWFPRPAYANRGAVWKAVVASAHHRRHQPFGQRRLQKQQRPQRILREVSQRLRSQVAEEWRLIMPRLMLIKSRIAHSVDDYPFSRGLLSAHSIENCGSSDHYRHLESIIYLT